MFSLLNLPFFKFVQTIIDFERLILLMSFLLLLYPVYFSMFSPCISFFIKGLSFLFSCLVHLKITVISFLFLSPIEFFIFKYNYYSLKVGFGNNKIS